MSAAGCASRLPQAKAAWRQVNVRSPVTHGMWAGGGCGQTGSRPHLNKLSPIQLPAIEVSKSKPSVSALLCFPAGADKARDLAVLKVNAPAALLRPVTLGDSSAVGGRLGGWLGSWVAGWL